MAMTGAERQARWREKRDALAKIGKKADPDRLETFLQQLEVIMVDLHAEGQKNMATMSPASVATSAGRLIRLVEAMRSGREIEEFHRRQRRESAETKRKVRTLLERASKVREKQEPNLADAFKDAFRPVT
jgi:hypothetical protein